MQIGLGLPLKSAPGFSPASLFSGGRKGFWYDPSDLSSLFQDSAGATPVSAMAQRAARVLDRAGNGAHLINATDTKCPLVNIDSGGRRHLSFDGVDDNLITAAAMDFSAASQFTLIVGFYESSDAASGYLVELGGNVSTSTSGVAISSPSTNATAVTAFRHRGATTTASVAITRTAAPKAMVATLQSNLTAPSINGRINGVAGTAVTTTTGGGTYGTRSLYVGMRGGSSLPFVGRIYGIIGVAAALTATELANAEAWMNLRTGAY